MPSDGRTNAILLALVIVLVLVILIQGYKKYRHGCNKVEGSPAVLPQRVHSGEVPLASAPGARFQGHSTPEQYADAERAAWAVSDAQDSTGQYNPENGDMQSHSPQPALDYNGMITGAIADSGMQSKHSNWVKEVKPWSKTLLMVDNMDEAVEQGAHRIGLTRYNLQAVEVVNPLMHVEGSDLYQNNKTFRFQG